MNEKELDEILNEIKNHSSEKKVETSDSEFEEILGSIFSKEEIEYISNAEPEEEKVEEIIEEPKEELQEIVEESAPASEEVIEDALQEVAEEVQEEAPAEEEQTEIVEEPAEAEEEQGLYFADMEEEEKKKGGKGKKIAIALIIVILIAALGVGAYFMYFRNQAEPIEEPTSTTEATTEATTEKAPLGPVNPLTGEAGYSESALAQRPVAVVVENEYSTASVKPQWGLDQADIVLEGESEFSTRLLLFWADYNKVPAQVGPTRSARPPFIHFSQLFDSVFIHAGLSRSKGNYVGADSVFTNESIDHINLLSYSEGGGYFFRDKSRTSTIEHTGCLNGTNMADMLSKAKIRTELKKDRFSTLSFNEEAAPLSTTEAKTLVFKWSNSCPKKADFAYDETNHKYTTTDFDSKFGTSNCQWENVIFLLDETEYIVKENYKHVGNSETYCNYKLAGGKGMVCSEGTAIEITWGVKNGKLWMQDSEGKDVTLNPGKSYIGYGSSNKGGYFEIPGQEETTNN